MIVPMKKIVLIVQQKDAGTALKELRSLGVAHILYQQQPKGKEINLINEDIALVDSAVEILSGKEFFKLPLPQKTKELSDWRFSAKHIVDLHKRIDQLEEYSRTLINRITEWQDWGDFEPDKILDLAAKEIYIGFYQIPLKEIKDIPPVTIVKKISNLGGIVNCMIISRSKIKLSYKEVTLPKIGPEKMRKRILQDRQAVESIKQEVVNYTCYCGDFLNIKKHLYNELEFCLALRGMGQAGALQYLTGFIPFDRIEPVSGAAKQHKWGLVVTEPSDEDSVPTLLRNSKWVSLIKPVFKLLEVVPGYRELDVSPLFLLFLSLFFGMIIGDAGYGTVYFTLTFLAQRKSNSKVNPAARSKEQDFTGGGVKDKTVFFLFYLFSFCAIIWGLLTGTVFGQQWYLAAGFKALAPALNEAKVLMAFCFLLGAVQLSLGHAWQAMTKLPSVTALADIGFICLLWVGFFLAKMFILGEPFPYIGRWLAWAGVILIILFISPHKNLLKGIGAGLGNLALGLMGNFGDVVSYIRLFAVGLAGVAVADSVNMLASSVGGNIFAQVPILFVGHGINIILGPMSVLVHGIRLNVLEFSLLHGNVTWSGIAYRPLKEM